MKIIINGGNRENKQMRRTVEVVHADEKEICEKAFKMGFHYVRSYRVNNITVKMF